MKIKSATALRTIECKVAEFKFGEAGTFSGYASIFGNVDSGGDIVERGAFQQMDLTRDGQVRVLYQHDPRLPIGKAKVKQDDTGLHFDAQLIMGISKARDAHEAMKAGILDGMSIGYDVLDNGSEVTNAGIRKLKALKLYEISPVTFGMNELARIDSVKQFRKGMTIREFEELLRDAGFSANAAKSIAAIGFKEGSQSRDASEDVKAMAERIRAMDLTGAQKTTVHGIIEKLRNI